MFIVKLGSRSVPGQVQVRSRSGPSHLQVNSKCLNLKFQKYLDLVLEAIIVKPKYVREQYDGLICH